MSDALGKRQRKTGSSNMCRMRMRCAYLNTLNISSLNCAGCYNDSEYYKRALKGANSLPSHFSCMQKRINNARHTIYIGC